MIHMELTMRSVALEMDTKVDVLVPEDRHQTTDTRGKFYPVLYILHGMKEDNSTWVDLSNIMLQCRDLDLIVVMPTTHRGFYCDNKYGYKYQTYITEELPTKLKNYLPISDKPEETFIMGESMGGYGTLRCALGHPEIYGKACCLSGGPISYEMMYHTDPAMAVAIHGSEEEYLASDNNLYNLADKYIANEGPKPDLIFYCGTEDGAYKMCKPFAELIAAKCPDKVTQEYWHGQHNFFFWNQAIPKALKEFGFDVVQNSVI